MELFEIKDNIVTINIDTNALKKFNTTVSKSKMDFGDYNDFLIEKLKNGNQDAIMKSINIVKNILSKSGCTNYEQFYKKIK